ncbi:hypothetical protein HH308_24050 [Gordonia sp. TBRC 11910]|uniref:Uncharacterized protein n=1 Tax=Gordonia asplenii TaxID=2725283 RepID=A0A848L1G2_9ACTN|nr:hypothetical protein [Gordonia asplenii]NMO04297.1 hypothetical protein [Gordonia asplenii]
MPRHPFTLDEPIVVQVPCSTRRESTSGKVHDVVLNPDWSLTTPHDAAAEAVAVALGGWSSCHEFPNVVQAVRYFIALNLRREWFPLVHDYVGRWSAGVGHHFPDVYTASAFVRSYDHAAQRYNAEPTQIAILAEATEWWTATDRPETFDRWRDQLACGEVGKLWEAGIHPDSIPRIRAWAGADHAEINAEQVIELAYTDLTPSDIRLLTSDVGSVCDAADWLGGGVHRSRPWLQVTR